MTKKEARYQNIAYQIAKRIVANKIAEGDKLRGRSVLAGEFNVSSETIRKAMRLLENFGVVEVKERQGIFVISHSAAKIYVDQHRKQSESHRLFIDTMGLLRESNKVHDLLNSHIKKLFETAKNDIFPFEFFTIKLQSDDKHINENLKTIAFWQKTHGLVLAVEVDGQLYQAPNPKMTLTPGMTLFVLGDDEVKKKTFSLFRREV